MGCFRQWERMIGSSIPTVTDKISEKPRPVVQTESFPQADKKRWLNGEFDAFYLEGLYPGAAIIVMGVQQAVRHMSARPFM